MPLTTTIRAGVLLTALMGFTPMAHSQSPTTLDYPGAVGLTSVSGISNDGAILGNYLGGQGDYRGFLDNGGGFTSINLPGARATHVSGISRNGAYIVGTYCPGPSGCGLAYY